jgi:hypothetical protein
MYIHNYTLPIRRLALLLFFFIPALLAAQTAENCTNGIDDDGDGLIDCFDSECTCAGPCDNFYYTTCNAPCAYVPPCDSISLGIQWVGQAPTGTYSPLVAGDMDADGIPEIVVAQTEGPFIYIIDGATGQTKVTITALTNFSGGTAPAIADLDNDGFGELVIVGDDRRLRGYEHTGALKFFSFALVGYGARYRYSVPSIADFNSDGLPEILIGNQIFNGQNGQLIASGGSANSAGEHPARVATNFSFAMPVAVDALPTSFCPDCAGLEIVAGNQVFSVNLATNSITPVVTLPAPYTDGFTSVVDFDRDGDLDAIVQGKKAGQNTIYVWDIQTPTVLREFQLFTNWQEGASRANVADLDGDGQLEVSFVEFPVFYALDNDFSVLWTRNTSDVSSITCSSVFDFCGNGSVDVIYRGQDRLQILDGATGQVRWEDECLSLTHIENPLVLDVDGDGQTEIVIECGQGGSTVNGTVVCYEAVGTPGIASRRVWNQHAYFNTNINDNLRVPRFQQNPHIIGDSLRMNSFLNQYFNPSFPSPDGVLTFQNVLCVGDSLEVTLRICNNGSNILPATTPLSFYRGNPQTSAAPWVLSLPIGAELVPDSCRVLTYRLPRVANDSVYVVLNDDHSVPAPFSLSQDFPVTAIGECEFNNNIGVFYLPYNPADLNLGPDSTLCGDATLYLNVAGNDLVSYQWQSGSPLPDQTITGAGLYSVTVTDVCGLLQSDTIRVFQDTSTIVRLGADRTICEGETFALGETGFDYYLWAPAGSVSCANCPSVTASPPVSGIIRLEAGFANGCKSVDTINVIVHDTFNYTIDTTICYGRTVDWFGTVIPPDSAYTFLLQTVQGCDSTVQVRVTGTTIGTYQVTVDTSVCLGSTLPYLGLDLQPGENKTFFLSAITGCDSTVFVNVASKDTFATAETLVLCAGESATIFGQPVNTSGVYQRTFAAQNGCDSTHTVSLTMLAPILIALDATPSCPGETTGSIAAAVNGNAPPFSFVWSAAGFSGSDQQDVGAGSYSLTVTDSNDCTETASAVVPAYPPINFSVRLDSVRCFGETNGAIQIATPDPTLSFSLDNGPFFQTDIFTDLAAGEYLLQAQDVNGCEDSLELTMFGPPPLQVVLPQDTTLRLGDSIRIDILTSSPGLLQYSWSDTSFLPCLDCPLFYIQPLYSISYTLQVTDAKGCTATDMLRLQVERVLDMFVPNVIHLNAANDYNRSFRPGFGPAVRKVSLLQFYDRWGNLLYEVRDAVPDAQAIYWDGRGKNDFVQPGVYVWMMELELVDGTVQKAQGDITVLK